MAQEPGLARAVVDEAVHADLLILGGEKGGEMKSLDLEAGVETDFETSVDGVLRRPQRLGGTGREPGGQPRGRGVHLGIRYYLVDEPDPQCLCCVHHPAGEDEVLGPGGSDESGQSLGATGPGDDSKEDLWLSEFRAFAAHPEIGAQCKFEAAAERVSGDRGHNWFGISATAVKAACKRWVNACMSRWALSAISLTSAPPANTFGPP